jgi:hypothetical protein
MPDPVTLDFSKAKPVAAPESGVQLDFSRAKPLADIQAPVPPGQGGYPQAPGPKPGEVSWAEPLKYGGNLLWDTIKGAAQSMGQFGAGVAESTALGPSYDLSDSIRQMAEARNQAVDLWQRQRQSLEHPDRPYRSFENYAEGALANVPLGGSQLYLGTNQVMDEAAKHGQDAWKWMLTGGTGLAGGMAAPSMLPAARDIALGEVGARLRGLSIKGAAGDVLDQGATHLQQVYRDAHTRLGVHTGQLIDNLGALDKERINNPIQTGELVKSLVQLKDHYQNTVPRFAAELDRITQNMGSEMTMEDFLEKKSEIGKAWAATKEATSDKAALGATLKVFDDTARARAAQAGPDALKIYNAYNKNWSTMMGFDDPHELMGKIMNAQGRGTKGQEVFGLLDKASNEAALRDVTKNLKPYGLNPGYVKALMDSHQALYDFAAEDRPITGKVRAFGRNLPAAAAGAAIGTSVAGPLGGGIVGASLATDLVGRMRAMRALGEMGIPMPQMGIEKVQPAPLTGKIIQRAPYNMQPPPAGLPSTGGLPPEAMAELARRFSGIPSAGMTGAEPPAAGFAAAGNSLADVMRSMQARPMTGGAVGPTSSEPPATVDPSMTFGQRPGPPPATPRSTSSEPYARPGATFETQPAKPTTPKISVADVEGALKSQGISPKVAKAAAADAVKAYPTDLSEALRAALANARGGK